MVYFFQQDLIREEVEILCTKNPTRILLYISRRHKYRCVEYYSTIWNPLLALPKLF